MKFSLSGDLYDRIYINVEGFFNGELLQLEDEVNLIWKGDMLFVSKFTVEKQMKEIDSVAMINVLQDLTNQVKERRNVFKVELEEIIKSLNHEQLYLIFEIIERYYPGLMFDFISNKWKKIVDNMCPEQVKECIHDFSEYHKKYKNEIIKEDCK